MRSNDLKHEKGLARRHRRVRGKISGTPERPRLCVTRSNSNIYAQVIDDVSHTTICGVSTLGPEFKATGKKGGTRFALTALVVVGDGNGRVGIGLGKSKEVPVAIKKGVDDAKKNMFSVAITKEGTVPHDIVGEFGAGRVLIMPAAPGTGVIAGGPARAVMELAGIKNVFAKSLGTNNAMNVVKAAADGLQKMQSPVEVAERRNMSVAQIFGGKEN